MRLSEKSFNVADLSSDMSSDLSSDMSSILRMHNSFPFIISKPLQPKQSSNNVNKAIILWSNNQQSCIALRKHMTLSAQKFKMSCVALSHSTAVRAKLKAMSKTYSDGPVANH
jgi:hypothetical protein